MGYIFRPVGMSYGIRLPAEPHPKDHSMSQRNPRYTMDLQQSADDP